MTSDSSENLCQYKEYVNHNLTPCTALGTINHNGKELCPKHAEWMGSQSPIMKKGRPTKEHAIPFFATAVVILGLIASFVGLLIFTAMKTH